MVRLLRRIALPEGYCWVRHLKEVRDRRGRSLPGYKILVAEVADQHRIIVPLVFLVCWDFWCFDQVIGAREPDG